MALTPSVVSRTDEVGDEFSTFRVGGAGPRYQGVVISDANGNPTGITGNALVTTVSGTVTTAVSGTVTTTVSGLVSINDATPIDVNIVSGIANPLPVTFTPSAETFSSFSSTVFADSVTIGGVAELRQLRVILNPAVTSVRYLMIWDDNTSSGKAGTAPDWRMVVPQAGEASESFNVGEFPLTTGLVLILSSTPATLTITTASEALFQVIRAV